MKIPNHVAIIMDGNGRWAQLKGRPRIYGHIRGSTLVRPVVRECGRLGVKFLTLYAFSAENWGRPAPEVTVLMRLLCKYLVRERKSLMANNVRVRAIGDVSALPADALNALNETIRLTAENSGLTLTFALSYGSRQEIVSTMKDIAAGVATGKIKPGDIDEKMISERLDTSYMPDPDLIIRTSGEQRLSNFLLWQAAYSEFYFTEKFWPEFTISELQKAFADFSNRTRRFGLTDQQLRGTDHDIDRGPKESARASFPGGQQ